MSLNNSLILKRWIIQLFTLIVLLGLVIFLLFVVWKIPQLQVGNAPLTIGEKARLDAETSARTALIQGIGGLLVFVTAGVSWLNLKATEERQVTERFSKAVEMLSDEASIYTRLGGIYALERIAKDSPRDHWQIMEILTAFVREKAKLNMQQKPFTIIDHFEESQREYDDYYIDDYGDKLDGTTCTPNQDYIYPTPVDIQAALTALGRRATINENNEQYRLDLSQTDLRGARLTGNFSGTNLEGANLRVQLKVAF